MAEQRVPITARQCEKVLGLVKRLRWEELCELPSIKSIQPLVERYLVEGGTWSQAEQDERALCVKDLCAATISSVLKSAQDTRNIDLEQGAYAVRAYYLDDRKKKDVQDALGLSDDAYYRRMSKALEAFAQVWRRHMRRTDTKEAESDVGEKPGLFVQVGTKVGVVLNEYSVNLNPDRTWLNPWGTLTTIESRQLDLMAESSVLIGIRLPDGTTKVKSAIDLTRVHIGASRARVPVELHSSWYVGHDPYWRSAKRLLVANFIQEHKGEYFETEVADLTKGGRLLVTEAQFDEYLTDSHPNFKALENILVMYRGWYRGMVDAHRAEQLAAAAEYRLPQKIRSVAAENGWEIRGLPVTEDFLIDERIYDALAALIERDRRSKLLWEEMKQGRLPFDRFG